MIVCLFDFSRYIEADITPQQIFGGNEVITPSQQEVCSAIAKHLGNHFLQVPSSSEEWLATAHTFQPKWQYPNCIRAIDGKHIVM